MEQQAAHCSCTCEVQGHTHTIDVFYQSEMFPCVYHCTWCSFALSRWSIDSGERRSISQLIANQLKLQLRPFLLLYRLHKMHLAGSREQWGSGVSGWVVSHGCGCLETHGWFSYFWERMCGWVVAMELYKPCFFSSPRLACSLGEALHGRAPAHLPGNVKPRLSAIERSL